MAGAVRHNLVNDFSGLCPPAGPLIASAARRSMPSPIAMTEHA